MPLGLCEECGKPHYKEAWSNFWVASFPVLELDYQALSQCPKVIRNIAGLDKLRKEHGRDN